MSDEYLNLASAHVIEHARRSNAKVSPAQPYMVRFPLSSGHVIRSHDTWDLVKKVARLMRRRDEQFR